MTTAYQRVFVTGANGFIGRALVDRYLGLGADVRGIDVDADPDRGVAAGDISDPTEWAAHVQGSELVIHTAAMVTNNASPADAWRVNVVGTRNVLDVAAAAHVRRFLHVSTMGVARHAQRAHADAACHTGDRDLDERWPLMPVGNPYTDTKLAAEHAVLAAHAAGELPCTIIRPADVYGPGSRPWVLEPIAAIRGGALVLPARGRGLLTLVYIDDLVDAVVAAGASTAAVGQIFHVGGEAPVTSAEYFAHLFRILGRRGSPRGVPTPVAVALAEGARLAARARGRHTELGRGAMEMLAKSRPVSNAKAHAVLGWWPRVDLVEGMQRVERWLRAEGLV